MPSIAIIGCGLIGEMHARCLAESGVRPSFFCDVDAGRASKLAAQYGAKSSDDPIAICGDQRVDAVYICTYHDTHAPLAVEAARHGKHVFLEKPMALSLTECRAICTAVEENRIVCMTGFKLHYYSLVAEAKQRIGTPLVLSAHVIDRRWPDDSWANDPVRGGGNVLSQGCHAVDLLCYLAGSRPVRIIAEGGNLHHPNNRITDSMVATIAFANGAVASLTVCDAGEMPHDGKFTVQAMNGEETVHLYDRLQTLSHFDGTSHEVVRGDEDGFLRENREFLSALAERRRPETDHWDGLRATGILLAGIESIASHAAQDLTDLPWK